MKAETPPDDKTPAGRPRDRGIDEAILRATAELLVSVGYAALTLAAVAQRAGTTKTALYRRWSSKAQLVHEAAFPAPVTTLIPESGDLTTDIRALIAGSRSIFTDPVTRAALPGLLGEVGADPVSGQASTPTDCSRSSAGPPSCGCCSARTRTSTMIGSSRRRLSSYTESRAIRIRRMPEVETCHSQVRP
jgi:hypothetical protein